VSSKVNTKAKIPGTIRDNIPRDPVKANVNNTHMLIDNTPAKGMYDMIFFIVVNLIS
jgi:hypothetical protein